MLSSRSRSMRRSLARRFSMLHANPLLLIDMTLLQFPGIVILNMSVPWLHALVQEHSLDFLKSLARCLGEGKEDMNRHGSAEDAEEDVHLPLDVFECWRDKV